MFVGGIVLLLDEVAGAAVLCKQERGFFHPNQQPTWLKSQWIRTLSHAHMRPSPSLSSSITKLQAFSFCLCSFQSRDMCGTVSETHSVISYSATSICLALPNLVAPNRALHLVECGTFFSRREMLCSSINHYTLTYKYNTVLSEMIVHF